MRTSFGGNDSVNFVNDHHLDKSKRVSGVGCEQQIEGFGSGDENVAGMACEAGTLGGRGVTSTNGNARFVKCRAKSPGRLRNADERGAQVALDVYRQRFY